MTRITINLFDSKSLDKAISYLDTLEERVTDTGGLVEEVITYGEEAVRQELIREVYSQPNGGYPRTGELLASVNSRMTSPTSGQVRVDDEAGVYVEYGTGLFGEMGSHPTVEPDPETGKMGYSMDSWVYPDNGQFWTTWGMASRPFFYRATKRIRDWVDQRLRTFL